MTHTPGPWKIDQPSGNEGEAEVITAPCGRTICWTADTWSPEDGEASVTEEDLANGRLIAAAPELLDALRYMVANAEADGWSELMLSDAKAAIAKAERKI